MRRAWFQIHLLTAVLLMFVAGVLVAANLRVRALPPSTIDEDTGCGRANYMLGELRNQTTEYGWPFTARTLCATDYEPGETFAMFTARSRSPWIVSGICANAGAAFVLLACAAVFLEWIQRRRLKT